MKKRFPAILLALVLCMGLAVPALAATVQTKAGANLTPAEQKIYQALETAAIEVAEGKRTSNKVTIGFEPGELSWSAKDLGLDSINEDNYYYADEKVEKIVDKAWLCLKYNLPFEMFWVNNSWRWVARWEYTDSSVWVTGLDCWLVVDTAYRGDSYDPEYPMESQDDLSADKIAKGYSVAEAAKAIVKANEGKSDYEKLVAYRDAICDLTSYNFDAEAENEKSGYTSFGDPWQLVYVFDKDPSTNVLCEGYAKAFKYLCDLSEFNGDVTCYIVEGHMDGGGHMWNVVRMGDGKFYLADITNSDTGMTGEHGGLFLTGASGSGRTYVVSHDGWKLTYVYREDNEDQYTDGYLPVSSNDYSPANDVAPAPKPNPTAYANTQTVQLDGKGVTFETYALKDENGNLTNYIKLRDLAHYLNGTPAQFEVEWSAAQGISLAGGKAYTPNGSELSTPFSGDQPYAQLSGQTTVNGEGVDLDAISLYDGGFTYYKLRDLGRALDFNVSYISGQIVINTSEPYSDAQ